MQIRHAVLAALAVSFAGPRPALPQQKSAAPVSATTTALARLSDDLQSLVERARPAVAQIMVSGYATPGEGDARTRLGEDAGELGTEAARRARDEGDSPRQIDLIAHESCSDCAP